MHTTSDTGSTPGPLFLHGFTSQQPTHDPSLLANIIKGAKVPRLDWGRSSSAEAYTTCRKTSRQNSFTATHEITVSNVCLASFPLMIQSFYSKLGEPESSLGRKVH
jgi:hypothetical protein